MMTTRFTGVFLTSADPAKTAEFYRVVGGFELEEVAAGNYTYWKADAGGVQFAIHDAEAFAEYAFPPVTESNLTHLYFHIDDHGAFRARLGEWGIEPVAVDDVSVTVHDPDGREVMFGVA